MRKFNLFIVLLLAFQLNAVAQNKNLSQDNKAKPQIDSTRATLSASEALELLAQEQIQRYRDSIEAVNLQLQIENTAEVEARRELEDKLAKKHRDDSVRLENLKAQIEARKSNAIGYPVVIGGDTIRIVYASFGTLSASNRADVTTEKIKRISRMYLPSFDTLTLFKDGSNVEIMFNETILTTITQSDAIWVDKDPMAMAQEIASAIDIAIVKHKKMTSIMTIVKQVGLSILIIVTCVLLIRLINRLFRNRTSRFMLGKIGTWFKGWKIRDYEVMDAHRQVRFTLAGIKIFRLALSATIIFIALPLIFSIYPVTQRLAGTIFGWVLNPIKNIFWNIVDYLPDLFVVIIIWLVVRYIVKGIKYITNEIEIGKLKIKGFHPDWASATFNIIRIVLYAFSFVVIFPYLPGSDSKIFQGVSVFLGLIVSIGSSSMISNMVAGLVITYMRPFKVGDHIQIGETTGDVLEKTAFVTRVKTYRQEVVTIPNSNVLSSSVVNYSTKADEGSGIIFHVRVDLGYEISWRDVHDLLTEAALRSEFVSKRPAPFVLQTALADFYISYQLCVYSRHANKQASIYSQLYSNIQDVCTERGVELLSPHFQAVRMNEVSMIPNVSKTEGSPESLDSNV